MLNDRSITSQATWWRHCCTTLVSSRSKVQSWTSTWLATRFFSSGQSLLSYVLVLWKMQHFSNVFFSSGNLFFYVATCGMAHLRCCCLWRKPCILMSRSGLLTAYHWLRRYDDTDEKVSIKAILVFYLSKYWKWVATGTCRCFAWSRAETLRAHWKS